jgi:hypothetical protein
MKLMWRVTLLALSILAVHAIAAQPAGMKLGREPVNPMEKGDVPQYIFFNKAPSHPDPMHWSQTDPNTFTPASCEEIVKLVGVRGNKRLRVGVSFIFSVMEHPPEHLARCLTRLLESARTADVPVLITIDGQNWWETRSDLWNWWDPSLPGFNPANRSNVEWTDWGPQYAVKIGWRNWGSQHRVRPAPNVASPRFLAEHWKAYDVLIPLIARWYRELPNDRKYLFGGLKVGWEASINVNACYYPDGNRIFEQSPTDASKDPTDLDRALGWKFDKPPLGYAAISTERIRTSGKPTIDDFEKVVHRYLERLSQAAVKRGIPRQMVFTHQGCTFEPWDKHLSFKPAMNDYSIPGWSFYTHDPEKCGSLAADLDAAHRRQWVASEWWRGADSAAKWREQFEASLKFKSCRLVCVYNWEPFKKLPEGLQAVRELVEQAQTRPAD